MGVPSVLSFLYTFSCCCSCCRECVWAHLCVCLRECVSVCACVSVCVCASAFAFAKRSCHTTCLPTYLTSCAHSQRCLQPTYEISCVPCSSVGLLTIHPTVCLPAHPRCSLNSSSCSFSQCCLLYTFLPRSLHGLPHDVSASLMSYAKAGGLAGGLPSDMGAAVQQVCVFVYVHLLVYVCV